MTKDPELVRRVKEDYRAAGLSDKDRAMLDYAVKLTLKPAEMQERDVHGPRSHGFTDAEILDIALVTSYYNFVNRVALGLGVELEAPLPS